MSTNDPRRIYILRVASHILSLNLVEEKLRNVRALYNFCDGNAALLVISRTDQRGHVDVTNELQANAPALFRVILYKTQGNEPLSANDYKAEINVITAHNNIEEAFTESFNKIFSNIIDERSNSKAKELLNKLTTKLTGKTFNEKDDDTHISNMTLENEFKYWEKRANMGTDMGGFHDIFLSISKKLDKLKGGISELDELYELLEISEDCIDSLWNTTDVLYTEQRMIQLIHAISDRLCTLIQARLSEFGSKIWLDAESGDALRVALTLLDYWRETIWRLTTENWPHSSSNEWTTRELKMSDFYNIFSIKIEKIVSIRNFPNEVFGLSGNKELHAEALGLIKTTFRDINPFGKTEDADQKCSRNIATIERRFDETVERLVPDLRARLQLASSSIFYAIAILDELGRYENFLKRKAILSALQPERESLTSRFLDYVRKERADFTRSSSTFYAGVVIGKFLTEIASKIVFLRRKAVESEGLQRCISFLCADLSAYSELNESTKLHLSDLKSAENELFNEWCREMIAFADPRVDDSIALETSGRLMVLEHERGGVLNVSYGDRLARLLTEVRQLQALGLQLPSKILQCAQVGEKFYQYGVVLKQVAHFYNTIEQQMLPCQQAMLLDEALAFERLIIPPQAATKNSRHVDGGAPSAVNVTWDDPERLRAYIEKLKEATFRLTNHNRHLRQTHAEVGELVGQLLDINMLRDEDKWAEKLVEIRQKFADEERRVGTRANMRAWVTHWDRQLYKVLQTQFRCLLETLQEQMPPVRVQLVIRDERIQLRPAIENIKSDYYKSLNKFLLIPQKFTGIYGDKKDSEMFASMALRNASRFSVLFEDSERMFDDLANVTKQFEESAILCRVNFEDIIEANFKRAADWETQWRLLKQKRRQVESIQSQIGVGCIRISTSPLKKSVDDALKRLYDTLVWTLKNSAVTQLSELERSINQGIEKLSNLPQNLDEIAEANQTSLTLVRSISKYQEEIRIVEEKYEVLRGVYTLVDEAASANTALDAVRQQFTRFESLLESHEFIMKEQVDILRRSVSDRISRLVDDAERLFSLWNQFKPRSDALFRNDEARDATSNVASTAGGSDRFSMIRAVEFVREKRQQFAQLVEQRRKIENECEQMELHMPSFPVLDEMQVDLEQFEANYLLYEDFSNELQTLADQEWILFRSKTYLFDEFLQSWLKKLNAKEHTKTPVSVRLEKDIETMKEFSGCLKYCRGEMLNADHWLEMFRLLKLARGTTLETLRFGDLIGAQDAIIRNVDRLKELNARAHGEVAIRAAIQELELWAAQAEFILTDYKLSNGSVIKIVKDWKNVIMQVKDNQVLLQSLKNLPYYKQFRDRSAIWEKRVTDLDVCLHLLNEIQRKWVYLEPIFGRGSLPNEATRFTRVDVEMRVILSDIAKDPRIISLLARSSLQNTLEQITDQLSRCQRALNAFLEEKRRAFPRFYFLGDDDLLEILGQSTNPNVIHSHLKKLFQGLDKVEFDDRKENIHVIVSAEGERVVLARAVRVVAQVESWLHELSAEMKRTLRQRLEDCLRDDTLNPRKYPSQILCLCEKIRFCADVERCLRGGSSAGEALNAYLTRLRSQLAQLSANSHVDECSLQLTLKTLVLDIVHHIDVVDQLLKNGTTSPDAWVWQKQLRFYALAEGNVIVRQAGAELVYTFEYQGNATSLVHTPLTDKCYLTLTQALSMGLGGNPYGPAGTGKTETVKALARQLGRQVLVFNCDEGIDVMSIGRIFLGIVQCGAWGCFDEFNRLEKSVLSTVSGQIQNIQDAIRSRAKECQLDEFPPVSVDVNSALFVTMNPASKAYGGRQRLPDNLKQLFRPVLMSVPENELIAEILLYADGFTSAKVLARKIVTAFKLSENMLSDQQHYDWGLRAIKTVLRGCGDALTRERRLVSNASAEATITIESETRLALHAIRLNTMSKLTFEDAHRFQCLLADIFPRIDDETNHGEDLKEHIIKAASEMKIQITERQMNKIFQLHEQLHQRTGVVVVGACGVGKSTIWRILARALTFAGGATVRVVTLNPKCMPRTRLLGTMDADTREWMDGVLTSVAREIARDTAMPAWIVFDGDVDPEWIEALNSVLDDNKLLTIPSGERIQFANNVNFIFETCDLKYASPATVSRMGMIFMSDEELNAIEIMRAFLRENAANLPAEFDAWIDSVFSFALRFTLANSNRDLSVSEAAIMRNVISQVRSATTRNQFLVGVYRGFLPYVVADKRRTLAQEVIFSGISFAYSNSKNENAPPYVYCDKRTDSLLVYVDDLDASDEFSTSSANLTSHSTRLIMTAKTQAAHDTISTWLASRDHFVVIGEDGCGKEQLLRHCFRVDAHTSLATIHCSAQTSSEHLEHLLMENCIQASGAVGRVMRPRNGADMLVVYVKSPNLIRADAYGTSSFVALLEQILTYNGFYDANLEWIGVENVQFVMSISDITRIERFSLPARLLSRFRMIVVERPDEAELCTIYGALLNRALVIRQNDTLRIQNFSSAACEAIAAQMVRTYEQLRSTFHAYSAQYLQYTFTAVDLTHWTSALMRHIEENSEAISSFFGSRNAQLCIVYEAHRIFRDRLVSVEHRGKFDEIIANIFGVSPHDYDEFVYATNVIPYSAANAGETKYFVRMQRADYITQLEKSIARFEYEVTNFNLAISDDVIDVCLAVERLFTKTGGSTLLAGRAGMGHAIIVRLIAHVYGIRVVTPRLAPGYTLKQFIGELKEIMRTAAVDNEKCILLVEDFQVVGADGDACLQVLNAIIAAGTMPGLYTTQEMEQIANALRNAALQAGADHSAQSYFTQKVRENFHIVLIMDVTERDFAARIAANPSLYKHCCVIWREDWTNSCLIQIADLSLKKYGVTPTDTKASQELAALFVKVFNAAPIDSRTPSKFRMLIANFLEIIRHKRESMQTRFRRLRAGVDKLVETRDAVTRLQKKAAKKSKILAEKQADADRALLEITRSMTGATDQKQSMEQYKSVTEKENIKIEKQKKIIEAQLADVEPLLKEAREAVGSIKTESLSEIRSLRAPPDSIRDILQAVLLFMGILDVSWEAMRRFLAKSGVKEEIINFDARKIDADTARRVQKLIATKSTSFDPKNAKRASAAAAPLAAWVTANLEYSNIIAKIAPLENERIQLERNLENAQNEMKNLSEGLTSLDKRVGQLKQNFEALVKDATQIKVDLSREEATITVAGTLVNRLHGEFDRWQEQIAILEQELNEMDICCLISAAFVILLGASSEEVRHRILNVWSTACSRLPERFKPAAFLAAETEQLEWKERGATILTWTNALIENITILFNSTQPTFIVDPSGRVAAFLIRFFQDSAQMIKATQVDFFTQVEMGIRFGKTLIVTDCDGSDGIDSILVPLLRKEYFSHGGPRTVVQFGAKSVDINEHFRLFLCSRDERIRLPEFVRSALTIVNFATTKSALSSQILSIATVVETPELEQRSIVLSAEMGAMRAHLLASEQQLLTELANAEGSILENAELLASLNASKENTERIHNALNESQRIQNEIDGQREFYRTFAQRCAQLYFAVSDLYALNPLYNFGVDTLIRIFRSVFTASLSDAKSDPARLDRIYAELRRRIYAFVARAVFTEDRLMFAIRFVYDTQSSVISEKEWEFFLGHNINDEANSAETNSRLSGAISWLSDENRRAKVAKLQSDLPTLYSTLSLNDASAWESFMRATDAENVISDDISQRLTAFQRVLVVQILRPDRLHSAMSRFAIQALGIQSLNESVLDWNAFCAEMDASESQITSQEMELSNASTTTTADNLIHSQPILVLMSEGAADPTPELRDVYARRSRSRRATGFHYMAMGDGGQRAINSALDALSICMKAGEWLCLSNVHLLSVDVLQKIYQQLSLPAARGFRAWLIVDATDIADVNLPSVFVQECVKLSYETPPGVRHNLERNLLQWIPDTATTTNDPLHSRTLFMLCWTHALIQERRTFIPEGWLKFYEFCNTDLRAARHTVENFIHQNSRSPDWEAFCGLMQSTIYGGRVENALDERVLRAYVMCIFGETQMRNALSAGGLRDELRLSPVNIRVPALNSLKDHAEWVARELTTSKSAGVVVEDLPTVLGMARNVGVSWQVAQSVAAIAKLRRLALTAEGENSNGGDRRTDANTITTTASWARLLAPILAIWRRINQRFPALLQVVDEQNEFAKDVAGDVSKKNVDPFIDALRLERSFGYKLARQIHTSLSAINKVSKGQAQPASSTTAIIQALIAQQVPDEWGNIWPAPNAADVANYLEEVGRRAEGVLQVLTEATNVEGAYFARHKQIYASLLFRPVLLLNAFQQYAARFMNAEIDTLRMHCAWGVDDSESGASSSPTLTLSNIYIQCAQFSNNNKGGVFLSPVDVRAPALSLAPTLTISWMTNERDNSNESSLIDVPMFADRQRTAFVGMVDVPCTPGTQSDWTLAGVAMFIL